MGEAIQPTHNYRSNNMQIEIYKHPHRQAFVAVATGNPVPDHAHGWQWFKSIDLAATDVRIGLADPQAVLASIAADGWSVM